MANDWFEKAKEKAQEAATVAKNAGSSLRSAAEQLGQNIKSPKVEDSAPVEINISELLANVEKLLKTSLEKSTSAIELLAKIKEHLDKK